MTPAWGLIVAMAAIQSFLIVQETRWIALALFDGTSNGFAPYLLAILAVIVGPLLASVVSTARRLLRRNSPVSTPTASFHGSLMLIDAAVMFMVINAYPALEPFDTSVIVGFGAQLLTFIGYNLLSRAPVRQ